MPKFIVATLFLVLIVAFSAISQVVYPSDLVMKLDSLTHAIHHLEDTQKALQISLATSKELGVDWLEILKVSVTSVLAVFAAWIAFQQYKTSKDKLRLDLFEKRYALYNSLFESWWAVTMNTENKIEYTDNVKVRRESHFLFDKNTRQFIYDFMWKLGEYSRLNSRLTMLNKRFSERQIDNPERSEVTDKIEVMRPKMMDMIEDLGEIFRPYLGFGHKTR